jgi:hypothetical protein|tara:strand:- start:16166 stop:16375 length:210 start_codon:yes stop_codon:yes gene_type:complete
MLQFQGDQYTPQELQYIHSALLIIKVSGEDARMLVNLQDKTQNLIEMSQAKINHSTSTPPGAKSLKNNL